MEVIDLCTPPGSPAADKENVVALGKRKAVAPPAVELAEDCDSDCEIVEPPMQQHHGGSVAAGGDNGAEEQVDEMDDDEVAVVPPPASAPMPQTSGIEAEDDEIQFVGRTGHIALSDFPHSRENCVEKPFATGQELAHCANCYCYVCDAPVSSCPRWAEHCKATHSSAHWASQRRLWKAAPAAPAAAAPAASSSTSTADAAPDPAAVARAADARNWSMERVLKEIECVYPVETPAPSGFAAGVTLRPYQRQSLAFMLDIERSTDAALVGMAKGEKLNNDDLRVELQRSINKCRHFLGIGYKEQLCKYAQTMEKAKKDLASIGPVAPSLIPVRGGWLCDEMGMGKTCVIASLILANPRAAGSDAATADEKPAPGAAGSSSQPKKPSLPSKPTSALTVVLCNNTLIMQWADEINKFAPNLVVASAYGTRRTAALRQLEQEQCDVFLTSPHSAVPEKLKKGMVHRVVIDESHLYEKGSGSSMSSAKNALTAYRASYVWCVTGTPFSTSFSQLEVQATVLGHWDHGLRLSRHNMYKPDKWVDELKKLMIRHTKSQRIGGEVALALPDTESETVWLEMSRDERLLYSLHACADGVPAWADENRTTSATLKDLNQGLTKRRGAAAHVYDVTSVVGKDCSVNAPLNGREAGVAALKRLSTNPVNLFPGIPPDVKLGETTKTKALLADLARLQKEEPGASVVCFTHYNDVQQSLVRVLQTAGGYKVFDVSAKTAPEHRQVAIKQFQESTEQRPKIFVTTYDMCAVGVTLTAASRVFMLEPPINPAMEVQAAGRIHRLGQSKEVLVKRFAYQDTIDEAVIALHTKIRHGELTLVGGTFPMEALACLRQHGVTQPHEINDDAVATKTQRRYKSGNKKNMMRYGGLGGYDYGRECMTKPCKVCGRPVEEPGTSIWWGKGSMRHLDGQTCDVPRGVRIEPAD